MMHEEDCNEFIESSISNTCDTIDKSATSTSDAKPYAELQLLVENSSILNDENSFKLHFPQSKLSFADESIELRRHTRHCESSDELSCSNQNEERLHKLEEEQDRLNNSLLALSTHFAQVQFRLKQISRADVTDRDTLLKELEEFAFKGCEEGDFVRWKTNDSENSETDCAGKQKEQQKILISRLKEQLQDLENFAYETGDGDLPSTEVIARQKAVIDQLHEKVQLNLDLDKMSLSDLQRKVDEALKKLVNPIKVKEQLVEQLQTQIIDLERFVNFLQTESSERPPNSISSLPVLSNKKNPLSAFFGRSDKFERNSLKNTLQGNHYGDVRAKLEYAVDATVKVMEKYALLAVEDNHISDNFTCETSDGIFEKSEEEIVTVVRKQLCPSLLGLLEHGMNSVVKQTTYLPRFGCYPAHSTKKVGNARKLEHLWDVILHYYDSKFGREFCDAPIRKLSQSYQLDAVGGRAITSKQILLSTIENVASTHSRLKRSPDAMWKALVSAALNERKLPAWIRIIFRTRIVVEECYASWAYVARTGCEDCYELLERLHKYNFNLPVDLAVRPFHQMKDAF